MADRFFVLSCKDKKCGIETALPLRILADVTQHQRPSATGSCFVNFVCPHCGLGTQHLVEKLETREAISVPALVRLPMYSAFLRCDNPCCEVRVLVHAIAQTGDKNAGPTKALHSWKVGALECMDGHRAKLPVEVAEHHVFAPEGE